MTLPVENVGGRRHVKISSHQFESCGWWHLFTTDGLPIVEWHSGKVDKLPTYYSIRFTDECWEKLENRA